MTDAELQQLYEKYAHVLFKRCRDILKNDEAAHDAVQETFAKVLVHASEFRGQSSPLTWMYRISTNHCLNQIRNRRTRADKRSHHREELAGPSHVAPTGTQTLDHARIIKLLDVADDQTRRVVIHTYFDDCTRQQTADLVGISVPTVRKRLDTFIRLARRALDVGALWLCCLSDLAGRIT